MNAIRNAKRQYTQTLLEIARGIEPLSPSFYYDYDHSSSVNMIRRDLPSPDISKECKSSPFKAIELFSSRSGRELIELAMREEESSSSRDPLVIEFGTFLAGSACRWLSATTRSYIVSVDNWAASPRSVIEHLMASVLTRHVLQNIDISELESLILSLEKYGFHQYVINCGLCSKRFTSVRSRLPEFLFFLYDRQIYPDLFYFDADKDFFSIEIASRLFPLATLCGDDLLWESQSIANTLEEDLKRLATLRGDSLEMNDNSWVIWTCNR